MIDYAHKTLWGSSGGQLEYVSQRIEYKDHDEGWMPVMVIRFTDHDKRACPDDRLIEGKYYELEFPLNGEG